jgi:molecular chaperone DnaK
MVKDAEAHAAEDRRIKETQEERNKAESLIYQTEKLLTDLGEKVPSDQKVAIENGISELRTALNGQDAEAIKQKTTDLQQTSYKLSELLYQASAGEAAPPSGDGSEGYQPEGEPTAQAEPQEEVIDAEFKSE